MSKVEVRNPREFGLQVRQRRRAVGLTAGEAASLVGVSRRLLLELEQGKRPNVGLAKAMKIVEILGMRVFLGSRGLPGTDPRER